MCPEPYWGNLQRSRNPPSWLGGGSVPPPQEPLPTLGLRPQISALGALGIPTKKTWVPWPIEIVAKGSTSLKRFEKHCCMYVIYVCSSSVQYDVLQALRSIVMTHYQCLKWRVTWTANTALISVCLPVSLVVMSRSTAALFNNLLTICSVPRTAPAVDLLDSLPRSFTLTSTDCVM